MREMHLQRRRYKALLHKMKSKDRHQLLQHQHLQQQQQRQQAHEGQEEAQGREHKEEHKEQLGGGQGIETKPPLAPGAPDTSCPPLGSLAAPAFLAHAGHGALTAENRGPQAAHRAIQGHAAGAQNSEASHEGLWEEAEGEASIGAAAAAAAARQGEGKGRTGGEGEGEASARDSRGESAESWGRSAPGTEHKHADTGKAVTECMEEHDRGGLPTAFLPGEGPAPFEGGRGKGGLALAVPGHTGEQRGCARTLAFPDDLLSACFLAAPDSFLNYCQQHQGQKAQPGLLSPAHQWSATGASASLWGPGVPLGGRADASCQGSMAGLGMGVGMGMGLGMDSKAWQSGDGAAAGPSRRRRLYRRRPHKSLFAAEPCTVDAHMAAHPVFSQYGMPQHNSLSQYGVA